MRKLYLKYKLDFIECRQIISILCIFSISLFYDYYKSYLFLLSWFLFITYLKHICITVLKKNFYLFSNKVTYSSIIFGPFIILGSKYMNHLINDKKILLGVLSTLILSIIWYWVMRRLSKNVIVKSSRNNFDLIQRIISSVIVLIAEEMYFRMYIIETIPIKSVAIVSSILLFVHIHYFNRWSKGKYTYKSYWLFFCLALTLSGIYYYFRSIIYCVIVHFFYNYALNKEAWKIEKNICFKW